MTARIKLDVRLSGGRVRLDLKQPTEEQLQTIVGLLEKWMDEEEQEAWRPPATVTKPPSASPRTEPIHSESLPVEQRELLDKVTGHQPATNGKRALCGEADPASRRKCRRYAGHDGTRHRWWERNGEHGEWDTAAEDPRPVPERAAPVDEPEPVEPIQEPEPALAAPVHTESVAPTQNPRPEPVPDVGLTTPGVHLCRCGHAERMHEKDDAVDAGRGACFRSACGCAEYRAAA